MSSDHKVIVPSKYLPLDKTANYSCPKATPCFPNISDGVNCVCSIPDTRSTMDKFMLKRFGLNWSDKNIDTQCYKKCT